MRTTGRLALVTAGVAMLTFVLGAAPAMAQAEPQQPPPQRQAQQPAPIQGELTNVDATAKTLAVKTSDSEVVFQYNDKTEVTGAKEGVAGLATMKGARVAVHFTEDTQAKTRTATRIIVQAPKQ